MVNAIAFSLFLCICSLDCRISILLTQSICVSAFLVHQTETLRSFTKISAYSGFNHGDDKSVGNIKNIRRVILNQFAAMVTASSSSALLPSSPASAAGLVMFPCTKPLFNQYIFMRSGTTLLEEEDIWSTNPLFLTNRESGLSEKGREEVEDACRKLESLNIQPSVIKYSFAASSMDTAEIAKNSLKIGQNRVVPEFNFMDPRAIGKWDMMSYSQTLPAVMAMDELEAGISGEGGRPPPNDDGTPHETLKDNSVRLQQLMSVLETQYSGDTILLVFPDGTSPALLSAMMAGIPFNQAHRLEYAPGEFRVDVTRDSTLRFMDSLLQQPQENDEYAAKIERGRMELQRLRSLPEGQLVSRKDQLLEKERLQAEAQERKVQEQRKARDEADKQARIQRQRDYEISRQRRETNGSTTTTASLGGGILPAVGIIGTFGTFVAVSSLEGNKSENASTETTTQEEVTSSSSVPDLVSVTESTTTAKAKSSGKDEENVELMQQNKEPTPSLFDKPLSSINTQTKEDRIQMAQVAMQEYLDEDDGGAAWLKVMGEIIEDDDDDGDDDEDDTASFRENSLQ